MVKNKQKMVKHIESRKEFRKIVKYTENSKYMERW